VSNPNPNPKVYFKWENSDSAADFLQILQLSTPGGSVLGWIDKNGIPQGSLAVTSSAISFSNAEVLTVSGVTGTLAQTPNNNIFFIIKNGQVLSPTIDYTLSGATVTFVVAQQTGDKYAAYYSYIP
jgi:hypothetical protein